MRRIGLISTAHGHADGYLSALLRRDDIEVMVVEPDDVRSRALREGPHARASCVGETEELYAWNADGVIVCSETARHADLVIEAARRGAAVLCEKPLTVSSASARNMAESLIESGVPFDLALPTRFSDAALALTSRAVAGELGELRSYQGRNTSVIPPLGSWFLDAQLAGGGAIMDHVVHVVDIVDRLFGVRPVEVTAAASPVRPEGIDVEVGAFVIVRYANAAVGAIDCSWREPARSGSWGGLEIAVTTSTQFAEVDFYPHRVDVTTADGLTRGRPADASVERMIDHFLDSTMAADQSASMLAAALRVHRVVLAARESAALGRPVDVANASH